MTDLIPRDAKHEEAFMAAVWSALKADATDLGKQQRILAAFRAIPAIDPAAIREAALREAAELCDRFPYVEGVKTAILALIGEKK
jgi:hypothetical protein